MYTCITFQFFALALGEKGVFYSYKKISMLHFCNWKKMHSETEFVFWEKKCPFTKLDIYVCIIFVRLYCLIITIDCVTNQSINHISYIIRYLNWQKNVYCFISTIYCVAYIYEGRILRCFMSEIKIENLILFVVSRIFSVSEGGNIHVWSTKLIWSLYNFRKQFVHLP